MSAGEGGDLPVRANPATGAVYAETDDAPVARPARWVANIMWLALVLTCAAIAIVSALALIIDFLAPPTQPSTSKDTILLLFSTSFNGLIALFVTRPGAR